MFCVQCGTKIKGVAQFCPNCGAAQAVQPAQEVQELAAGLRADCEKVAPEVAQGVAPEATPEATSEAAPEAAPEVALGVASLGVAPVPDPPAGVQLQPSGQQFQPQFYEQPFHQPQFAQQQPFGEQQFMQPTAPAQPEPANASKKKKSKAPLIVIGTLLLLLIAGATVGFATGFIQDLFENWFEKKDSAVEDSAPVDTDLNALSAFVLGTANLLCDAESATVELEMGISFEYKWEYGKDLRSSTIWLDLGDYGMALKDDTLYVYESWRGEYEVKYISNFVDEANRALSKELNASIDLNKIINDGKLDKDYIEKVSKMIGDAAQSDGYNEVDLAKITEILNGFSAESNKKDGYNEFLTDTSASSSDGVATYESTYYPVKHAAALSKYAEKSGSKPGYRDAADAIIELCEEIEYTFNDTGGISFVTSLKENMLAGLEAKVKVDGISVKLRLNVKDINATKLSDDSKLNKILKSSNKERIKLDDFV